MGKQPKKKNSIKGAFLRTCAGCGEKKDKRLMLRVCRLADGTVLFDDSDVREGRGAHICKNSECVEKARKTGRVSRILKAAVPDEIFSEILNKLNGSETR